MRLKYVGPHEDGVDVPELGRAEPVAQGEIIDVDDELGRRLATSADWQVTSRKRGGGDEE